MPKRTDIETVLVLGAGPIVIGQACEFDYSGVQACRALREEGCRVVLVNSNPATIMTDPAIAHATYIEPITWRTAAAIIEAEKVDAVLPTMGGQTALNCALDLDREGVLSAFGAQLIGAQREAIDKAEDREKFARAMRSIGLEVPRAALAHSLEESLQVLDQIGFPAIIRPSYTLGGSGGGIAFNREEFLEICRRGLDMSPTSELLIDESLIGWKEFEMEVVRDSNDNCIIVCSIENLDPMGIHTGDSITVAPAQTLTDREYQCMRDNAIAVLREIGVETGGSNVQFAVDPADGRQVVIEMNPRVSRSSALASKATGFPIARIATKLAMGYTLDELRNEITGDLIPASFEPAIDYVVTKIPRFAFEKFEEADPVLGTQMKSVGEVMAIGRSFQESLHKALRSLENGSYGLEPRVDPAASDAREKVQRELHHCGPERLWYVADAFRLGMDLEKVAQLTGIDQWFLSWIEDLVAEELRLEGMSLQDLDRERLLHLKRKGFSDRRLAEILGFGEDALRECRQRLAVQPVFRRVDTCAAEFPSSTAYMYSTYGEEECEAKASEREKIMVLGSGPNRIGQGIEFDYCCVHAALSCREDGYETIMVNCNPETVSTDCDTSDRLYFEPVTLEDTLAIVRVESPRGVIVQFGGQTPLKLARGLQQAGVPIIGTSPDAIDQAEDRERFQKIIHKLGLRQPKNATARSAEEAVRLAEGIGYPLVVRPSYVLGGRAMEVVYNSTELWHYMQGAMRASEDAPVLLDHFLDRAIEVDIDAVSDGREVVIGAIMQHIEQAGVHSGDSACALPPYSLSEEQCAEMRKIVTALARSLKVVGLINVQLAVQDGKIYVIEVNPRASRTVPFVSKAIGVSLAAIAARCMTGRSLAAQGFTEEIQPPCATVKEAIFPFVKFPGVDPILGPEMKSTGEVMGFGDTFAEAYAKAQLAAGETLPALDGVRPPAALLSVRESDKSGAAALGVKLQALGFRLVATKGTARALREAGCEVRQLNKVKEGRPHVVDAIKNGEIDFIVNTTEGRASIIDSATIRRSALSGGIYYTTTLAGAEACCQAMQTGTGAEVRVRCLQTLHGERGSGLHS